MFDFNGRDADIADLNRQLVTDGFPVITLAEEPWDLQDVYLQVTEGTVID